MSLLPRGSLFATIRNVNRERGHSFSAIHTMYRRALPEFLALKQESRILRHSSNPVGGFSMTEQSRSD